ncbi:hypothetical protein niasHS_003208 [Heterodera schachtii]|uniref:Uncharacterized protein n=1 Tax=Heterodera schachtii TaxID=97005 RepID=A0ABD2KH62_HETSC
MSSSQNYSSQKLFNQGNGILRNENGRFISKLAKNKAVKVLARIDFPKDGKSRFNYENQLQIMLGNQNRLLNERIVLKRTIYKSNQKQKLNIPYEICALKSAKLEVENSRNVNKIDNAYLKSHYTQILSGSQLIRIIAKAMSREIDQFNNAMLLDKGDESVRRVGSSAFAGGAEKEQLRFVGLVLWHLVFRDCPIIDPTADEFVFIAKVEPSIDATDPNVAMAFCAELDSELARKSQPKEQKEEKKVAEEMQQKIEKEFELFERLEDKIFKDTAFKGVELEKYNELHEKFELLRMYWDWQKGERRRRNIPFYGIIDRAFIAFGSEAPVLIVFIRVLLEGAIGWTDFSEYIQYPTRNTIRIKDSEKYYQMMRQLEEIWDGYGL